MLIRYHGWWPSSSDPYYQYNVSQNTTRINYYGADYSPHFHVDGTVDDGGNPANYESMVNGELSVESPLEISITGAYNSVSRQCDVSVNLLATGPINNSNLKLRIALVESNLAWQAPNGSYWHHQTFRNMYPNTSGVSFSISEGQTYSYDYSFTVNSALNVNNCDLVVFVQSDAGHRILQGAIEGVTTLSQLNILDPFSLISPPDGALLQTCYPHFEWQATSDPNSGNQIDYSVYIAQEPTFATPLILGPTTETNLISEICLIPNVPYYWKVLASNGIAPDRFSEEVFTFSIEEVPVPTLSEWGMFLMGLLLLAFGTIAVIQRRRSRVSTPAACNKT